MSAAICRTLCALASVAAVLSSSDAVAAAQTPSIGDNDERLPYHLDSLMALGLVAFAAAVALAMNHRKPGMRVFGIGAAALGCVAVAAGIFGLDMAGQYAELRPPRFAIDPHKPIVMRVLAVVFLLSGLLLGRIAYRQLSREDELRLARRNDSGRFGRVSRFYHWTIVVLILLLIPMGVFTTMIPYDIEYRQAFYVVHKSVGLTVLLLAIARIIWLAMNPPPPFSAELAGWERGLARGAHYAFYFFLFAFPISGFVLGTSLGKLSHFYLWDFPLFWGPDEASLSAARWMHKIVLPFALYFVLMGHVLGAVKHQYADGQADAFRRMVT